MDEEAKDEIIEHINPRYGLEDEIERVLNNNDNLKKSSTWDEPTTKQESAIKSRLTTSETYSGSKFEKNDKTYIRIGSDNYKRVIRESGNIVRNPKNDKLYYKAEGGKFKGVIDES